ncbi:DUF2242 domain-containing protein [Xanthomonas campestris pv. campestris]|uniref:DUF2242 domain-containing protein n=1 Tax=Xanthomonas campestris TaxID=339 RepID=UPI00226A86C9|nr:DUF2242 domain-containing protein [Xanthomonas campestris]MDO0789548.1 DUF2242 domain-containing protein [Xanthomonas campestris pv. campestris]MDO0837182.1 DUF2242 domain-containing protein [Xanthomonas campestris pv. campestris]MEB1347001.1 DUF2242 domain-containing protein [Xanthomonas campestris pv. campestris]WDK48975.1 DUF2242 domain-containing protein [Xanthomonas campestris pv. campestris]WDK54771.1 DUF2242 domain-containing protein [Xanthomonas campestris pv. campestris]
MLCAGFGCRNLPMSCSSLIARGALLGALAALAGCGGSKGDTMLMRESFNSDDTYSRNVSATSPQACEAARRVLLSQGYAVTRADAAAVEGSKNFQLKEADQSEQLNLRISCAGQDGGTAQVFVSALQDRYALKKSSTSASVGVGVLGSLSVPVGSSGDSLVRVSSTTVQDAAFYKRFFERLNSYLPKVAEAAPAAANAMPESAPAAQHPPAEPAAAPAPATNAAASSAPPPASTTVTQPPVAPLPVEAQDPPPAPANVPQSEPAIQP